MTIHDQYALALQEARFKPQMRITMDTGEVLHYFHNARDEVQCAVLDRHNCVLNLTSRTNIKSFDFTPGRQA